MHERDEQACHGRFEQPACERGLVAVLCGEQAHAAYGEHDHEHEQPGVGEQPQHSLIEDNIQQQVVRVCDEEHRHLQNVCRIQHRKCAQAAAREQVILCERQASLP